MNHEEAEGMSMGQRKKKGIAALIFMVLSGIVLTACLYFADGRLPWKTDTYRAHRFGATYMTMNNPFYEIIDDEIRNVLEARGDVLITRDPALDVEKQIAQVREMIERRVDGIFINPVDWKSIGPAIEEAAEAGIPIIVVDSDVYDAQMVSCTVVSDNYQAGVQCAEHLLAEQDGGNILILTHSAAKSGIDRIQGFKDAIAGHGEFHILAEEDCLGQLELAMPVMEKLLKAYPQADVVMCLNDLAAMGAMAALKENGQTGQIAVYGVDGSPDGKSMIKEGIMEASAAQFPRQIGRAAAETIYEILDGKQTEPVVRIETELITRENLDQYGNDGWQ